MRSETRAMTCDRCGKHFRGNPRSQPLGSTYCSLSCEEGKTPLPSNEPASPRFFAHIKSNPGDLIGYHLVADGLKRTCYSPEWHRAPESVPRSELVSVDRDEEVMVYQTAVHLGEVVDYTNGLFIVQDTDGKNRAFQARTAVSQLKSGNWWAE